MVDGIRAATVDTCCWHVQGPLSIVMDDGRVADIKRGGAARNAKLASLARRHRGPRRAGLRQAADRHVQGRGQRRDDGEGRQPAVHRARRAQGRRDEGRPGAVGHGGRRPRAVRRALPRGADQAAEGRSRRCPRTRCTACSTPSSAPSGATGSPRSTTRPSRRPASARCTRRVWSDGREVAVKIQYPGADEALRADLKTMKRMVCVFKQLAPGADIQGVVDELIERTEMELDYRLEADNQRAFAKAYEDHPALRGARDRRQRAEGGHRGVDRRHPAGADHPRGHRRTARPDGHPAVRAHLRRPAAARDDARRRASRQLHAAARRQDGRHRLRRRRPAAGRHARSNSA